MIVCSKCKHGNMTGALFCVECGSQLSGKESPTTQTISTDGFKKPDNKSTGNTLRPFDGGEAWGSLHLLDTGQMFPLSSGNEFTLGRVSEGQPIMPDIDLSPYQAYSSGVSRLHAVIRRAGSRITLMDLGSANGTYVNGKRLSPNVEQAINHGDIVTLGKMKIQILVSTR